MNVKRQSRKHGVVNNEYGVMVRGYGSEQKNVAAAMTLHTFGPWPLGYNGAVDAAGQQYAPNQRLLVMAGIQRVNGVAYDPIDPANGGTVSFNVYMELTPFQVDGKPNPLTPRGRSSVKIPIGENNQNLTTFVGAAAAPPVGRTVLTAFPLGPAALSVSFVQANPATFVEVVGFALWSVVPSAYRMSDD